MTDLEILKDCFKSIKLNYIYTPTLIGFTIIVKTEAKELHYEFNIKEEFIRVI